jgi:hypothetical protein
MICTPRTNPRSESASTFWFVAGFGSRWTFEKWSAGCEAIGNRPSLTRPSERFLPAVFLFSKRADLPPELCYSSGLFPADRPRALRNGRGRRRLRNSLIPARFE